MAVFYRDADANLGLLIDKTIAVLGYGNMGRPMALNLRDSAFPVVIGNLQDGYAERAYGDGFEVVSIAEAADRANILLVMLPDEITSQIYVQEIGPGLRYGDTLVFASGYNIAFGFVEPPPFVDVVLIAPQATGLSARDSYVNGSGFPSIVAVEQDVSGEAWARTLAIAKALGALRRGAIELTFRQEAELDLFGQQAVMPAIHAILQSALEVLSREGFPPEAVLLSQYLSGELGYIISRWAEVGVASALDLHPRTAQYGTLSRIDQFREVKLRRLMETVLDAIRSGSFAQEWAADYSDGYPRLEALRRRMQSLAIWRAEQDLLARTVSQDETAP